jgi:hypothetical protein
MERSLSVEPLPVLAPLATPARALDRSLSEPPEEREVEAVADRLEALPMEEAEAESRSLELPGPEDGRRSTQGIPEVGPSAQPYSHHVPCAFLKALPIVN